mgnify:FL=1
MVKESNNSNDTKDRIDGNSEKKMEICYTCGKEFDMNNDEGAHYHYGEFPMCGYCSNFYGFYKEDLEV